MEHNKKIYCTNCGNEMNEEAEVCTSCGVRQGKVIHYCYCCGNEIGPNQELCLNCGVNPRKLKARPSGSPSAAAAEGSVNVVLAAVLGFLIPGLPSILWYNQKTKGIVLLVAALAAYLVLLGWIISIASAVDASQLAQRVNEGESLEEWTFFWNK